MQTSSDQFEVRTGNMGSAAALYNNRLQCNVLWQLDGAINPTPLIAMGNKEKVNTYRNGVLYRGCYQGIAQDTQRWSWTRLLS